MEIVSLYRINGDEVLTKRKIFPLYIRTLCATSDTASEYVIVPLVVWLKTGDTSVHASKGSRSTSLKVRTS